MGLVRNIFYITGVVIISIAIINFVSLIIDLSWMIFWVILGGLFIITPEIYFFIKNIKKVSNIGKILDQYERITESQIVKYFEDKPAYKVLPVFRNYKKGIIVMTSGKYIHYNDEFIKKFIQSYNNNNNLTDLSKEFNYSKTEIQNIINKLKSKKLID
ncbi:MAG: hypothetical protein ACTSPY_06320 [Candidatus Helarchaeota archaeon]